ncbi:ketoacyl-ACP synthase III [Desulfonema ishimotonii]|uniref:Ketoacyl-ACP synthase III n=1 Tax=Desulfonema ishimotonii TaxID=45657 RepID=A0A401G3E3_9BACT|nr:ketoacyl-ACP synthase III [Desulfonema ishimotonii]GBC63762.1 ketoacyl-ACP synthase III [Desulfonema ishimotonii]
MNFKFLNKKISGILSVVPNHCVKFSDEIGNYGFSKEKCLSLQKVMGFDERRIVAGNECASDLCLFGLEYLFERNLLDRDDIDALIFITQTPDHLIPPTSSVLHGRLGLGREVLCFDINHGCTGYLYGLLQAFLLLEHPGVNKVVLLNGDTLSRCACPKDRNIYPLIGDAGTISVVEHAEVSEDIFLNLRMDGSRSDWLTVPAGAFRMPSTEETRKVRVLQDGNQRSDEHFHMNGPGIFTFSQTDVPDGIKALFGFASAETDEIDYFMFHQPNRFMLKKLARKLNVPEEKMPNNVVGKFGNSSSASIPVAICHNISRRLLKEQMRICMSGFGVGLSWGALIMGLGPLEFCGLIEK